MAILYCFSRQDFNKYMDLQNWTDETLPNDVAIISICCTEPVKENLVHAHYDGKTDFHRFADKENVLNLDFDDITEEIRHCEGGYDAIGITKEQAEKAVKFIDAHKNSDFFIHCNAGKSRSQAFVKYIQEQYPDRQWVLNPNNPCLYPNVFVSNLLKRSAYNLFQEKLCLQMN